MCKCSASCCDERCAGSTQVWRGRLSTELTIERPRKGSAPVRTDGEHDRAAAPTRGASPRRGHCWDSQPARPPDRARVAVHPVTGFEPAHAQESPLLQAVRVACGPRTRQRLASRQGAGRSPTHDPPHAKRRILGWRSDHVRNSLANPPRRGTAPTLRGRRHQGLRSDASRERPAGSVSPDRPRLGHARQARCCYGPKRTPWRIADQALRELPSEPIQGVGMHRTGGLH